MSLETNSISRDHGKLSNPSFRHDPVLHIGERVNHHNSIGLDIPSNKTKHDSWVISAPASSYLHFKPTPRNVQLCYLHFKPTPRNVQLYKPPYSTKKFCLRPRHLVVQDHNPQVSYHGSPVDEPWEEKMKTSVTLGFPAYGDGSF